MIPFAATVTATWVLTRGSGVVSLLLLSASLALGIVNLARWRSDRWPRFVLDGLHRNVALLAVAFVGVHVAMTTIDHFTSINLVNAVLPFSGSYKPLWLGLGAIAFDLLLALIATSLLRRLVGYRAWRATHWLAYACWPVAVLHGIGMGTDRAQPWMLAVTLGCVALVAVAGIARLALAAGARERSLQVGTAAR
jgi:methionine sulfoxide reductase heme-binding subunit